MIKTKAITKQELYRTCIRNTDGLELIADEGISNGGKGLGYSPKELLCASLASCTSITIRMYANHKQWNVKEITVHVELSQTEGDGPAFLKREITLKGNLNEEQRERILNVANSCPVHKILRNSIEIQSQLI